MRKLFGTILFSAGASSFFTMDGFAGMVTGSIFVFIGVMLLFSQSGGGGSGDDGDGGFFMGGNGGCGGDGDGGCD